MRDSVGQHLETSRWLHWWAQLTVVATFVLLFLGSVVTTFRVGMADPVWPTYPWHLLLISWEEPSPGFIVEHAHRAAGYLVGCCVIALAVGLWRMDSRGWVKRIGVLALVGVIVQGLLGGFRVRLHEILGPNLALIHGCFAQLVFALLVSLAVVTSPRWIAGKSRSDDAHPERLQRWALGVVILLFVQIVLGTVLRHTNSGLGQRGHLLMAFTLVLAVAWLWKLVLDEQDRSLVVPMAVLTAALALQVLLGVETWIGKFVNQLPIEEQQITFGQAALRTAHVLMGYIVLSAGVVMAWRSRRQLASEPGWQVSSKLEGAV
jgi:cytochrome c oxidase assembly protein subunit 15